MKKYILIFIISLGTVAAIVAVLLFLQSPKQSIVVQNNLSSFPVNKTQQGTQNTNSNTASPTTSISSVANTAPKFIKISNGPVTPGIVIIDGTSTPLTANIRYVESKSGNMYDYKVKSQSTIRLSNKTIPGVKNVSWLSDGSLAYLQYFSQNKTLETYAIKANDSSGFSLPQNIFNIDTYQNNTILMLSSGTNGSIVTRSRIDGTRPFTAFQTPLSKVFVTFAGTRNYFMYTRAAASINGYAFLVNRRSGAITRIAGPLKGLVAKISPNGKLAIISFVDEYGAMQTNIINITTHTTTSLPVATIADKCTWAPSSTSVYCGIPENPQKSTYPDYWYQGVVSFSDNIWQIDITNHYTKLLLSPSQEGKDSIDVTSLTIDKSGDILSFINKSDGSLWKFQL